jgi:hypothetical protein
VELAPGIVSSPAAVSRQQVKVGVHCRRSPAVATETTMPGRAFRIALLYAAALPVPATILVLLAPDLPLD